MQLCSQPVLSRRQPWPAHLLVLSEHLPLLHAENQHFRPTETSQPAENRGTKRTQIIGCIKQNNGPCQALNSRLQKDFLISRQYLKLGKLIIATHNSGSLQDLTEQCQCCLETQGKPGIQVPLLPTITRAFQTINIISHMMINSRIISSHCWPPQNDYY